MKSLIAQFTALTLFVSAAAAQDKPQVSVEKSPVKDSKVEFKMVKIPAGEVEVNGQKVQIKSLWVEETEATWDMYDEYAYVLDVADTKERAKLIDAKLRPSKPYADPGYGHRTEGYPAMSIHPKAAENFCKWMSEKTGKKYRLLTEAEYEYAARAGGASEKLGDMAAHKKMLDEVAWYDKNSVNDAGDAAEQPVAKKKANPFGLYDMLGNVGEWTVAADGKCVLKGGSFNDSAKGVRSTARQPHDVEVHQQRDPQDPKSNWWLSDGRNVGFRLVREE